MTEPAGDFGSGTDADPDTDAARPRAVAENADILLGVKARMSENVIARHGTEPLKRAIRGCELSGVPAKVMCHIGGVADRALMSELLDLLRPATC